MRVMVEQPEGYEVGAWISRLELDAGERDVLKGVPSSFALFSLPKLPYRLVIPDRGSCAIGFPQGLAELMGVLDDEGAWFGHLYTNGVGEQHNPTPISEVVRALEACVANALESVRERRSIERVSPRRIKSKK